MIIYSIHESYIGLFINFNMYYLIIVLITVYPILLFVGFKGIYLKKYKRDHYKKASSLLKAAMVFGLVAFIAGN